MKKHYISVKVEGTVEFEVQAEDLKQAIDIANKDLFPRLFNKGITNVNVPKDGMTVTGVYTND